jgi:type VI protein secretion system component VasK
MLIAADYPFMDVFWSMLVFFLWVSWLIILFRIVGDIFRRRDTSGWAKAAWTIFVIALPFLGVLIYMVVNGAQMGERDIEEARRSRAELDDYIRSVASADKPAT